MSISLQKGFWYFECKDCFSLLTEIHLMLVLSDVTAVPITWACVCGNTSVLVRHVISSYWPLCKVLTQVTSTLSETLLVFGQTLPTHFINQPFHHRYTWQCANWTSLFSSPFATEPVRFSAVVPDLIARAPEVFLQEVLCLPRVCDRSRGDGWYNGVYLRSHSLALPSVWHSN